MEKKNLNDYWPEHDEPTLIQARVPRELAEKVREKMELEKNQGKKVTWNILIEASLRMYLDQ